MMRQIVSIVLIVLCVSACKQKEEGPKEDLELKELFALMQGSFNSEMQAKADSTYLNISLHMYPIWEDKGHFLYVEQAMSIAQNRPYRQRIYELLRLNDSVFESAVYAIPNDSLWIGKWKTPEAFNTLTKDALKLRSGCSVFLRRNAQNRFSGQTNDKSCESFLRGASYATSEVEITPAKIVSWDRGFNAEDKQVWGAEKGGYIFDKLNQ